MAAGGFILNTVEIVPATKTAALTVTRLNQILDAIASFPGWSVSRSAQLYEQYDPDPAYMHMVYGVVDHTDGTQLAFILMQRGSSAGFADPSMYDGNWYISGEQHEQALLAAMSPPGKTAFGAGDPSTSSFLSSDQFWFQLTHKSNTEWSGSHAAETTYVHVLVRGSDVVLLTEIAATTARGVDDACFLCPSLFEPANAADTESAGLMTIRVGVTTLTYSNDTLSQFFSADGTRRYCNGRSAQGDVVMEFEPQGE